ncbi:uncharacterized protein LOC115330135 [Ixodes scapularis]|uniref:uncharacterized protein LOC115330135 n=1 Tax=Ixodes scapularis TaxID=6945 RepID=UPI001C384976|nr:uncharacterized protein LOC115330135 [Ixodes scapularis]
MVGSSIAPTTDKPPRRTASSPPQSSASGTLGKLVGCLCLVAGIALGTIILATFFLSSAQRRSPADVNAAAVSGASASLAHLRKVAIAQQLYDRDIFSSRSKRKSYNL